MTEPIEEIDHQPEKLTVSQLLCIVKYGADKKGLVVTLSNGKLKLIDLEHSQQKTEDFLDEQQRSQSIVIEPDSPAHNQYLSMITDPDRQLAHFQYPPAIENVEVALLNVFESPEYLDNVAVADVIIFKVGMELGEVEKYRTTVAPFARGLSQARLGQAWDQTSLLISMQGDLNVQHPQARILVVSLQTENGQLGHSVAAGEKLLTNIVSALIHDVQPKNGGEREPYIGRLLERYAVTATEFVDAIMEQLEAAHARQVIESIALGKVGFLENIKKNRERDKIESQLRKIIKTTENILDVAADGLVQDPVIAGVLKDEGLKKLFQPVSLIPLVETLLINALTADAGEHYTPADIVQEIRDLGYYLLGSTESRATTDSSSESAVVSPEPLKDLSESPKPQTETQKLEVEDRLFFPQSSKAEIGAEVIKSHYGEPSIKYHLESGDKWPVETENKFCYEGESLRFVLRRDRNNRTQRLLSVESTNSVVIVNGSQALDSTGVLVKPGDVVSIVDTTSNRRSTFFYSASRKLELLMTSNTQGGIPHMVEGLFAEVPQPFTIEGSIGRNTARTDLQYDQSEFMQSNVTWAEQVRLTTTFTPAGEHVNTLVQLPQHRAISYVMAYPNGNKESLHASVRSVRIAHGMELIALVNLPFESKSGETTQALHHLRVLDSGLLVSFETQEKSNQQTSRDKKETIPQVANKIANSVGAALTGKNTRKTHKDKMQTVFPEMLTSDRDVVNSFIAELQSGSISDLDAIRKLYDQNQELVFHSVLNYLDVNLDNDVESRQIIIIGLTKNTTTKIDGLTIESLQAIPFGSVVTLEDKQKNMKLIFSVNTEGKTTLLSVGFSNYLSSFREVETPYDVIGQVTPESDQKRLYWETIGVIRVFTKPDKQSPSMLLQLADKYRQHQIIRVDSGGERFQGIVTSGTLELGLGDWVQITIGKFTYALELLNSGYIVSHVIE